MAPSNAAAVVTETVGFEASHSSFSSRLLTCVNTLGQHFYCAS